ncbi:MAG: dolichyl-phosphate beta-glucosyltransferase [Terriglobia bacterium]
MAPPYLSVVIPAYNEASRIPKSLSRIRQHFAAKPFLVEVIVVDDGSQDATRSILRDAASRWQEMRVLGNPRNRGKGFSVRQGVLASQGRFVLFTDADLSAPIEESDKLLALIESTGADAVIGSRALDRKQIGIHQNRLREWGGIFFNFWVRLFTRLEIHDTQCGLKLFRSSTTRSAFEAQRVTGFGFDPEVLFLIERSGGRIVETPVRWDNDPATKVRLLRDSTRMFWALAALRWRAWRGKYPPAAPLKRETLKQA